MATITITYTAPAVFASDSATQQIFGVWNPATTASDNPTASIAGSYYDTNVWDNGEFHYATTLADFFAKQVAHPGLVAALKAAMRTPGTGAVWAGATAADEQYAAELQATGALADQGFAIVVANE